VIPTLDSYRTLVFDCDGVILDSNKVKTQAFYQAALSYGEAAAQALVRYHVANGGVSRYKKFAHFLDVLVPEYSSGTNGPDLDVLLAAYADAVQDGLLQCQVAEGLADLRAATPNARWFIVSGGDQDELRTVFAQREIADWFDGGIFGSPDTKDQILARELHNRNLRTPAIFIGDSKYDYQAAKMAGLDFLFMHGWTEVGDWETWSSDQKVKVIENIRDLTVKNAYGFSSMVE
jgi:phosphoglycolate phosphatase-like HAD superfamily hydrolase